MNDVEKGINKILSVINYNPSSNSNSTIENPFIQKLLIYYFIKKDNVKEAMKLIKTKKISQNFIGNISNNSNLTSNA